MKLSESWETEISLISADVKIEQRHGYLVIRSEKYRDHIWKNFLLYPEIPKGDFVPSWMKAYRLEFPDRQFSIAFGWNHQQSTEEGQWLRLQTTGFKFDRSEFLVLQPGFQQAAPQGITIKPLQGEEDWQRIMNRRIAILCCGAYRDLQVQYEIDKFNSYRCLTAAQRGNWYVAAVDGTEVGDMGIFLSDRRRGSVEEVLIYPPFRRQGYGRRMVSHACAQFEAIYNPMYFVTLADDSPESRRLCSSVGFKSTGFNERAYWHQFMMPTFSLIAGCNTSRV